MCYKLENKFVTNKKKLMKKSLFTEKVKDYEIKRLFFMSIQTFRGMFTLRTPLVINNSA